jgi:hypothetical protein
VGCVSGERVIVSIYIGSSKDRGSISIIETISAVDTVIPPVLIIQAKLHMES